MADEWTAKHLIDIGVGALLALGAGFFQSVYATRARRAERAEDKDRDDREHANAAYVTMLTAASEFITVASSYSESGEFPDNTPYLAKFHASRGEVELYGSAEVIAACDKYRDQLVALTETRLKPGVKRDAMMRSIATAYKELAAAAVAARSLP